MTAQRRDGPSIVVATWNLQGRPPAETGLHGAIEDWGVDLLLLEEADGPAIEPGLPDHLPARAWWPYTGTGSGIGMVARWPFEEIGVVPADGPWDVVRVGWARLHAPVGPIRAVVAHLLAPGLPGTWGRRDAQRAALAHWAAERANEGPIVVGGDLNTREPELPGLVDVAGRGSSPSWRPLAVRWLRPLIRIDALFVSAGLAATDVRVDDRWRGSDHCPVVARITRVDEEGEEPR